MAAAIACGVLFPVAAVAADDGEEPRDPGGWTGLPVLGYAPETSLLLGGVVLYRFDVGSNAQLAEDGDGEPPRKSAVQLVALYSLNHQMQIALGPSLYLDGENWRLSGNVDVTIFPSTLYPLGQDSPDRPEDYNQRSLGLSAGAERRVIGQLRVGGEVRLAHATVTEVEPGGLLESDALPGSDGGFLLGLGPSVAWDDRDIDTATRRGGRHEVRLLVYPEPMGSDFGFSQAEVQLRQFLSPWLDHVVAAELYAQLTGGHVPFQMMATLGGDRHMRGYFGGRYRDRHQLVGQVEYRMPVWWRFGIVGFVGAGNVAHELSAFKLHDPKVAGGLGLRFALSPEQRVNLRVDFATTRHEDFNVYVSIGEAF